MKKNTFMNNVRLMALVAIMTIAASANAMSYEQARNEALFLTDKMAYELNLTEAQYEAAFEINLDYLMGVTSYDDVYSTYWERRNLDLSYVLLDWQWEAFCAATYFYRPLYWDAGYWHFGIYARYPHRDYFYFGRPAFYATYRGGHAWHHVGGHGYYHGHRDHFRPAGRSHFGMLDRWNRGDYRHNNHMSSTRTTVHGGGHHYGNNGNSGHNYGRGTYGNNGRNFGNNSNNGRNFGGYRNQGGSSYSGRTHSEGSRSSNSSGSFSGGRSNHSSGSFGGGRSSYSSGSFSGGRTSSGSFGGGRSHSSGSFGGGRSSHSSGSFGGGRSSGGGRSFGGHR